MRNKPTIISGLFVFGISLLTGCGGGGGSSSSTGGSSGSGGVQGTITPYVASSTTLSAKQMNFPTTFYGSFGSGTGCSNITNTTVYQLPNTVTYAANGVSELSQQQAAEYAEQAVGEIRTALGLSASVGFNGARIQICVQPAALLGSAQGIGEAGGFLAMSTDSASLSSGYLVNNFDLYKKLMKHELVHTYQLKKLASGNFAAADTWFTEGLAEYIASGKSSKTKAEITALITAQNPVAVITSGFSTTNLQYYPAFQSTVAYLFDVNGAKNNLSQLPAFLALVDSRTAAINTACNNVYSCTSNAASDGFTQAFEATFKEADGVTPMRLRTGTNNLQSTISSRLNSFLN
jgi:hypothetical protein